MFKKIVLLLKDYKICKVWMSTIINNWYVNNICKVLSIKINFGGFLIDFEQTERVCASKNCSFAEIYKNFMSTINNRWCVENICRVFSHIINLVGKLVGFD